MDWIALDFMPPNTNITDSKPHAVSFSGVVFFSFPGILSGLDENRLPISLLRDLKFRKFPPLLIADHPNRRAAQATYRPRHLSLSFLNILVTVFHAKNHAIPNITIHAAVLNPSFVCGCQFCLSIISVS